MLHWCVALVYLLSLYPLRRRTCVRMFAPAKRKKKTNAADVSLFLYIRSNAGTLELAGLFLMFIVYRLGRKLPRRSMQFQKLKDKQDKIAPGTYTVQL